MFSTFSASLAASHRHIWWALPFGASNTKRKNGRSPFLSGVGGSGNGSRTEVLAEVDTKELAVVLTVACSAQWQWSGSQ